MTNPRRCAAAVAVGVVALAGTPAASANTAPRLDGARLVYASETPGRSTVVVRRTAADGSVTELGRVDARAPGLEVYARDLAVAGDRVYVVVQTSSRDHRNPPPVSEELLVFGEGAAPRRLVTCEATGGSVSAVEADTFVVSQLATCADRGRRAVEVRDAGGALVRVLPGDRLVAAAGRYAAVWDPGALTVWDVATGERLYAVALGGLGISDIAMQADGTIAVAHYRTPGRPVRISVASAASPALRDLGLPAANHYDLALDDGTLAFSRQVGRGYAVGLADLAGAVRPLGRLVSPLIDLRDGVLAFNEPTCRNPRLRVVRAADMRPVRPQACRRLTLLGAPELRKGRLRVVVRCSGWTNGCPSRIAITARGRTVGRGRARELTSVRSAGSIRLSPDLRRRLAGGRRVRVRIVAVTTDAAGRRERRAATVTLGGSP